ncbi:MAG: TonB-dependent receptor [Candidatus Eiseniibacteriota bacterium]
MTPLAALLFTTFAAVVALPSLPAFVPQAFAGTTGRLVGRVTDAKGGPLAGVNVAIPAARVGAVTGVDGQYTIVNIPAGTYEVRVNLIGYHAMTFRNVVVSADQTARQDVKLTESAVALEEVTVTAQRPVVDVGQTSSIATITRDEIVALPVQDLQDIVDLQAGVVDGHFRGGRLGEVQFQVDGVSVNNVYDNMSSIKIDRSLLEEVQVISGTFDAEYGQAASGVVNAVLRRGTDTFTWNAELFGGQFVYPGHEGERLVDDTFDPGQIQNYQADMSGPLPISKTNYLLSLRRGVNDEYVTGTRTFVPTDEGDFENQVFVGTGDGATVTLGTLREWTGIAKITNRSLEDNEISYQFLFDQIDGQRMNWNFRLNPDGENEQTTMSIVHGFDWTHTLSKDSFYQLAARQNYVEYTDWKYEDVYDTRYDEAGPPLGDQSYENGAYVQGVDFTRFYQKTNALVLKGSFVSQATRNHYLKAGGEFQWPWLQFGAPGSLIFTTVDGEEQLVRQVNNPPQFPGVQKYHPLMGAAYAQDELDWKDLKVRAGLRLDYFDARSTVPSDLSNPANAIQGVPQSHLVPTTAKWSLSPRVGVSYPVSERAAVFFAYGHFTQMPALGTVFSNSNYGVLANLQSSGVDYGVLGNPDVKPEMTVQYQVGYKHALSPRFGVDIEVFYKDIRDLLGVEFISTYNDAEYARLTNVDFGNVIGTTISIDQRPIGLFSYTIDYTWQVAEGNSSDPRETATRAEAGQDPRPREVPFNWDQRHTFNATLRLERIDDFSASSIVRVGSGQPYTPSITAGFGGALEQNSGRKPTALLVDLRGEKSFRLGGGGGARGLGAAAFVRVFNLFDTRYFNGFVFSSSGSPYYSRFPTADAATLADPTRYYGPRRIEFGVRLAGASLP